MNSDHPVTRLFPVLSHGVYLIGVAADGLREAFTAVWVTPVSMEPPMLTLALHPRHASYRALIDGGLFSVCVLRDDQRTVADLFANPASSRAETLRDIPWHASPSGAPVIDDALAYFDCRIVARHPAGDHIIVVAEVTAAELFDPEGEPLRPGAMGDLGTGMLTRHEMSNGGSANEQAD